MARAADRPCLVTDEIRIRENRELDSKTREQLLTLTSMPIEVRDALLETLALGRNLPSTKFAVKEGRTALPVSAVLPVLERWGYDLVAVKSGLAPHYFKGYESTLQSLTKDVDYDRLFKWTDFLKSIRRTVTHPLNAQLVIEQALLRYRKVMNNESFE